MERPFQYEGFYSMANNACGDNKSQQMANFGELMLNNGKRSFQQNNEKQELFTDWKNER